MHSSMLFRHSLSFMSTDELERFEKHKKMQLVFHTSLMDLCWEKAAFLGLDQTSLQNTSVIQLWQIIKFHLWIADVQIQCGHFEVTFHCESPEECWEMYDTFTIQILS